MAISARPLYPYSAVLVASYGGPEKPEDVLPFMRNATAGRGVPDERLLEVSQPYMLFGGPAPINQLHAALMAAVRAELVRRGVEVPVVIGNRNWNPYFAETTRQLVAAQEQMFAIAITGGMFIALVWFDMPVATVMVLVLILGRMLAQFGKVQKEYQKVAVGESAWLALEKTIAQARMARDTQGGQLLPSLDEGIRLESVCLRRGAMPVLENLDLEIPACALVTLMGASGCGKTTILDLITGLVEPSAGRVLVDGVPLELSLIHI